MGGRGQAMETTKNKGSLQGGAKTDSVAEIKQIAKSGKSDKQVLSAIKKKGYTVIRDGTAQKGRLDVTVVDKNDPLKRIKVFKDYKIVNNKEVPLERYIVSTQNARLLRGGK